MRRWLPRAALSLTALVILFAVVPLGAVRDAMARTSVWVWIASMGLFFVGHSLNAVKLRWLIGPAHVSMTSCLQAQFAGLAANLGMPGLAGGDLVRGAYLVPQAGVRRVTVASLSDRLLDSGATLLIVAVALPFAGVPPAIASIVTQAVWWIAGAVVMAILAGAIGWRLARGTHAAETLRSVWTEFSGRRQAIAGALAISFLVQPAFVLTNVWLAREVGVTTGVAAWFVAWPLAKLVAVLPISLGGIGVREGVLVSLLAPYGAPSDAVLASGILWQGVLIVSGLTGLALTQLWRGRVVAPPSGVAR